MHSTGYQSIGILANSKALGLRRAGNLERLQAAVQGRGQLYVTQDLDELAAVCASLRVANPARLAVAGGDGTIMRVVSQLRREYGAEPLPPLLLLPFGTVNTTTRRVMGRRVSPFRLLETALASSMPIQNIRLLDVRIDGTLYTAATLGAGLVSHFFDDYERTPVRGYARASQIFLQVLLGACVGSQYAQRILAPVPGQLTNDGHRCDIDEFTLLVCSIFQDVGLGLRPTYRAGSEPGHLHLLATDLAGYRLASQAFRVLRGKPLLALGALQPRRAKPPTAPHLVDVMTPRFRLDFVEPTSVILDGERVVASTVEVCLGPEMRVFVPTQGAPSLLARP